jgi:hypothetical protein
MLLILAVIIAAPALAQGPPTVALYYSKGMLTNTGDDQGEPIPDGTEVRIRWDWNANGPDDKDPLPVVGNEGGNVSLNRFEINGEKIGLKAGQFYTDPLFAIKGFVPSPPMYYLQICLEDRTLQSNVFRVSAGYSEVDISEWTVVETICKEIE